MKVNMQFGDVLKSRTTYNAFFLTIFEFLNRYIIICYQIDY